jgi:anti-sigma factor RsiW
MTDTTGGDCAAILANIAAFLDGDLDATACAAIEAHCASCSRCAPLVQGLRQTIGLCREAAATPLPDSVRARARTAVRRLLDELPPE